MTDASIGHGNLFQMFDTVASPDAWVTIGEVKNITPPQFSRDAVDATHTESPDGFREFVAGLSDAGEMSCELNLVPDSYTMDLILGTFSTREPQQFRILFADGTQTGPSPTCSRFTANGIVTGFPLEAPMDDVMSATLTVKITGKPTFVRAGS